LPFFTLQAARHWLRRHPAAHRTVRSAFLSATHWTPGLRRALARLGGQWATVPAADYRAWIRQHDQLTPELAAQMAAAVARMPNPPLISVVMPAYNTPAAYLRAAIDSVRQQIYPHWELCIADDASPQPHVAAVLQDAAARDARIRFVRRTRNGHISAASNTALSLATGDFVALMDHDDLLPPHALAVVAHHILRDPALEVLFSDEDKVDEHGRRSDPHFKPGWNPELLLAQNLVSHLGIYRRRLLEAIGGFREGFEGSQDWDLALRATAALRHAQVRHIPMVLYHWRQGTGDASFSESALERCAAAGRRAVAEHLHGRGEVGARVLPQPGLPGWARVAHPLPPDLPKLSVILNPAGGGPLEARRAAFSLQGTGAEILPAAPAEREAALRAATGEMLLFLDAGLRPDHPEWFAELLAQALRPEVGAAGPLVVSANGLALHAGLITDPAGTRGREVPYLAGLRQLDAGYHGQLRLSREVSALGGHCLLVRRATFEAMPALAPGWLASDTWNLTLCRGLRQAGCQVIWTPRARLRAPAVATRRPPAAVGQEITGDPFFNPNFSTLGQGLRLRGDRSPLAALVAEMGTHPYA